MGLGGEFYVDPFYFDIARGCAQDEVFGAFQGDAVGIEGDFVSVFVFEQDAAFVIADGEGVGIGRFYGDDFFVIVKPEFELATGDDAFLEVVFCGFCRSGIAAAVQAAQDDGVAGVVVEEGNDHFVAYLGDEVQAAWAVAVVEAAITDGEARPYTVALRVDHRDTHADAAFAVGVFVDIGHDALLYAHGAG